MKKFVARNSRGQKCFCKYEITETGLLSVVFFVPIYRFSIYWPLKRDLIRINGVRDTLDGRKTMIRFLIHPAAWMGKSFNHPRNSSIIECIEGAFECFINLYE